RMIETLSPKKELEDLQADLREVQELMRRHRLVEGLVERQEMPKHELVESLVHRQNVAELHAKLDSMHPADIAYVLESLPLEERAIETGTRDLRRFDALPHHTDQIFVVGRDERFKGVLPLSKLIVSELEHNVGLVMVSDVVALQPGDKAQDAAKAFERYDLVSAPVVDEQGKLVGRVTVDKVVDFIRSKSESELLTQAGLREEE